MAFPKTTYPTTNFHRKSINSSRIESQPVRDRFWQKVWGKSKQNPMLSPRKKKQASRNGLCYTTCIYGGEFHPWPDHPYPHRSHFQKSYLLVYCPRVFEVSVPPVHTTQVSFCRIPSNHNLRRSCASWQRVSRRKIYDPSPWALTRKHQ